MLLNNELNEAYERIAVESENSALPNPFTLYLYDRITCDLDNLEAENGDYSIVDIDLGPNGGVRVELGLSHQKDYVYSLEYTGDRDCIYWQRFRRIDDETDEGFEDGCSNSQPF